MSLNTNSVSNKYMYVKQQLFNNIENQRPKVLINPNFVQNASVKPHFNKQFLQNQTIHVNPKILGLYNQKKTELSKIVPELPQKVVLNTPTKLIRLPQKLVKPKSEDTSSLCTSIHTKYKIIRRLTPSSKPQLKKFNFKSRFAIDNRITKKSIQVKKLKLSKAKLKRKEQLLVIRGQKYKLNMNHRTLRLISESSAKPNFKTIRLGNITFKQKQPNIFIKVNVQRAPLSQAKQKSIRIMTRKMRKSNVSCPLFRKFGKCKGKDNGTCIRIHNPDQISLCTKFLQGACINNKCPLSHKISAEKMPTCKFFLEGLCSKDDCPYLHVKISPKAEICNDFLEGFCKKGANCDKRHQYLCPDYEKAGNCTKTLCQYPHGNMASRSAEKLKSEVKIDAALIQTEMKEDAEKLTNVRYYDELKKTSKECVECEIMEVEIEENNVKAQKRPRLGDLPAFIPFFDNH